MSRIIALYNPAIEVFDFSLIQKDPLNATIEARLLLQGQEMPLINFSYGFLFSDQTGVISSSTLPPPGVEMISTDQELLDIQYVELVPGTTYTLSVWFTNFGQYRSGDYVFEAPYPPKPFPSWTWSGEYWAPPVPIPNYPANWDEPTLSWVMPT